MQKYKINMSRLLRLYAIQNIKLSVWFNAPSKQKVGFFLFLRGYTSKLYASSCTFPSCKFTCIIIKMKRADLLYKKRRKMCTREIQFIVIVYYKFCFNNNVKAKNGKILDLVFGSCDGYQPPPPYKSENVLRDTTQTKTSYFSPSCCAFFPTK